MSYLRSRADLLRRFRDGDRAAMGEVYRAYLPALTHLLQRGFVKAPALTNPDDRADLVHDVFARAFRPAARLAYDGERDYWPYLAMIARNEIVSFYRRRGQEVLDAGASETTEAVSEDAVDATRAWLEPRSLELTRRYVASLPEPMRSVHAARYVQALSQRDTAAQLGLSRPKVRKLESKFHKELLGLLTRAGVLAEEAATSRLDTAGVAEWIARRRAT